MPVIIVLFTAALLAGQCSKTYAASLLSLPAFNCTVDEAPRCSVEHYPFWNSAFNISCDECGVDEMGDVHCYNEGGRLVVVARDEVTCRGNSAASGEATLAWFVFVAAGMYVVMVPFAAVDDAPTIKEKRARGRPRKNQ